MKYAALYLEGLNIVCANHQEHEYVVERGTCKSTRSRLS